MSDPDYTFEAVEVDPGEQRQVELNFFDKCANFWRANERFDIGDWVQPTKAMGYAWQSSGGRSAAREPIWAGTSVSDGSITWTRGAEANGLNAISSPSAVSDPTGMTIGNATTVSESVKLLPTYSGGTLDTDYDAVFTFTLNGRTRVARQKVQFRKQ